MSKAERRAQYQQYLRTPHWRRVRIGYFKRHPKMCFVCTGTERIQLHHRTYENLGYEPFDDLVPLCLRCHQLVHEKSWDADTHILLSRYFLTHGETGLRKRSERIEKKRVRRLARKTKRRKKARRGPRPTNAKPRRKSAQTVKGYYACPHCHALPGEKCRTAQGNPASKNHAQRFAYANSNGS